MKLLARIVTPLSIFGTPTVAHVLRGPDSPVAEKLLESFFAYTAYDQDGGSTTEAVASLERIMEQCPSQTGALSECYEGEHGHVYQCVDSFMDILSREGVDIDCSSVHDETMSVYHESDMCVDSCEEEVSNVVACAVGLVCGGAQQKTPDFMISDLDHPSVALSDSERETEDAQINSFCAQRGEECKNNDDCCSKNYDCGSDKTCYKTCFSLESTVDVKGKGPVSIKDLVVGDLVLSDEYGTYTKYYSKGHYNEEAKIEFVRLYTETLTKPIELAPGHMVYKSGSDLPIPAGSIKVGDVLKSVNGSSEVTSIRKITRNGLTNPMTLSGTIVVDGIVASIHSEESGFQGSEAGWVYLAGRKLTHWHTLMHFVYAPHRVVCGKFMPCEETLSADGFVPFAQYLVNIHDSAEKRGSVLYSIIVLLVLVAQTAVFATFELFMQYAAFAIALTFFSAAGYWVCTKKFGTVLKAKTE